MRFSILNLKQIITAEGGSCAAGLSDTSHFHIDLFGNYIPGLCSGLAIPRQDLRKLAVQFFKVPQTSL